MPSKRPKIVVTHDDDGGVTVRCPLSGVVISVIETHPDVIGTKAAIVEVYPYEYHQALEFANTQQGNSLRRRQFNLWTRDVKREERDA